MDRISTSSAVANLFGVGKPGFSDSVPTALNAKWFNVIQEELATFIEAQGITLDAEDNTQLAQALAVFVAAKLATFKTDLLNGADAAYDTLKEIQTALEEDDTALAGMLATIATLAKGSTSITGYRLVTDTAATLLISDAGGMIDMSNASDNAFTVPADTGDSTVDFPVNGVATVSMLGAGQTTIVAASGVTLTCIGLKLSAQYSSAQIIKTAANTYRIIGGVVA